MTPKQLKFYQLFYDFSKVDVMDEKAFNKAVKSFLSNDFVSATDVWEFMIVENESKFSDDKNLKAALCDKLFPLFLSNSAQKTVKAINDNAAVRRAVYQYALPKADDDAYNILLNLLLTNKTSDGEEIFKCLIKNQFLGDAYGKYLKALLERIFLELLKKSGGLKIEMSRKLSALLLSYIQKIKTDERAMLEQRIKEVM